MLGKCYQISENTITPLLWSNFLLQKHWQTELNKLFFYKSNLTQTISYSEHMPNNWGLGGNLPNKARLQWEIETILSVLKSKHDKESVYKHRPNFVQL